MNPVWLLIALLVAGSLRIICAVILWRQRSGVKALNAFALLLLLGAAWCVVSALDILTAPLEQKILLFRMRLLFLPFISPLMLETIYRFAYGRCFFTGKRLLVGLAIPFVTVILSCVGRLDPFFGTDFHVDHAGVFPVLLWHAGPWTFVNLAYAYVLEVVALFLLIRLTWQSRGRLRKMNAFLVAFMLVPIFTDWLFRFGWTPTPGFNYTPVVFGISGVIMTWAIIHYRILDLAPLARSQLVELLKEILIVIDPEDRVVDLNRAAAAALSLSLENAIDQSVTDLLAPWPHVLALLAQKTEGVRDVELELDGKTVVHEYSILPVPSGGKERSSRILLLRDISERKCMEAELQRAKERAEASDEAKSHFLAMMSHEIRTPLNGVVGFAQVLEKTALNPEQKEYVNLISRSSELLLVIINDILDYSKIEAGRIELDERPFDLKAEVEKTCLLLALRAEERKLNLLWKIDPDLPSRLIGDSVRIGQILTNLIGNAIKFTSQGEVHVHVRLVSAPQNTPAGHWQIALEVRDTGIGMSRETIERLFQPFSQADSSTSRHYGGTGLGLAICRRLAEVMGGSINAESELKHGSTFTCILTLQGCLPEHMAPATRPGILETRRVAMIPLQILVVEDNEINQRVAGALLKRMGHEVVFADNGLRCLEMLEEQRYDAILMDIGMPGMDGFETVQRLRQNELERGIDRTHVIALTAHAMAGNRDRCLASGMDDFLSKPINPALLKKALQGRKDKLKIPVETLSRNGISI